MILLALEVEVLEEQVGPPDLVLVGSLPKASRVGRNFSVSPQSFEQVVAALGWRVTSTIVKSAAFELILKKPFIGPITTIAS
ncbi:hypothetical protein LCGC14_0920760 [marine sediment metagenome]|uniref:Uncharacterized protein n=1 Tax=marine sediment metagenome TaxID=412755 RepID=A0A0F9NR01_9ZZZZ